MIAADLEMSGLDPLKNGIWQIGALDSENPSNTFLEESRIDDDEEIQQEALKVIGKTEEELRDKNKQSQKQLLENFFKWTQTVKVQNLLGQSVQADFMFLLVKASKHGLKVPFHHRIFETHSIAALKYLQVNKKLSIEKGHSGLNLTEILKFCGLEDNRRHVKEGQIVKEGKPHNALEDSKMSAECFSRLMYGKNLLEEFKEFPVPDYLKN